MLKKDDLSYYTIPLSNGDKKVFTLLNIEAFNIIRKQDLKASIVDIETMVKDLVFESMMDDIYGEIKEKLHIILCIKDNEKRQTLLRELFNKIP